MKKGTQKTILGLIAMVILAIITLLFVLREAA